MNTMEIIRRFVGKNFGVSLEVFINAIKISPSAQGYILGAISEILLKDYLIDKGFEVKRIKEKPRGGAHGKSAEARGDFYIKRPNDIKWLVIECKGLKSNAEFSYARRKQLSNKDGLKKFLVKHAIKGHYRDKQLYKTAKKTYDKKKAIWRRKNRGKSFPPFGWSKEWPGSCNCRLLNVWSSKEDLEEWVDSLGGNRFTEESYRRLEGPIVVLETHAPSKRKALQTGFEQASPLVYDFSVMAVDLFLKTGNHRFVFMNPLCMNHSPESPEHLYQNYIIDILVPGIQDDPTIVLPWYNDIDEVLETHPSERDLDYSQIDDRDYDRL